MAGSGSGVFNDRIVSFTEVKLGLGDWNIYPGPQGFLTYFLSFEHGNFESSSITITRSDGKVLTIDISREQDGYFTFDIYENVIKFPSQVGTHADEAFQ